MPVPWTRRTVRTLLLFGLIPAVVLGFGLAAVLRTQPDTAPGGDMAVIDVHVLNVVRHLEPVGEYSRFGWSHPGPLYSIALAPLYSLSGFRHLSTAVTAALLNVAAIWLCVVAIRRWSRDSRLLLTFVGVLALFLWSCNGLIASPWNPHVPVLWLALLVVAAGGVVAGHVRALPVAAFAASFIVQTHVGFGSAALALSALALIGAAVAARAPGTRAAAGRALVQSIVVGAVCWALPMLSRSGQANLQQVFTFFLHSVPANPGLAAIAAQHYLAAPFTPHLTLAWGGAFPAIADAGTRHLVTAEYSLLVIAATVGFWRGRRFEASVALAALVAAGAAYWSILRLPEPPKDYTVFWVSILGVIAWASIGAAALDLVHARLAHPVDRLILRWTPAVVLVAMIAAGTSQIAARASEDRRASPPVEALTGLVRTALTTVPPGAVPLLHVPQERWQAVAGIALQLYRTGPAPHVDADWVSMFGTPFEPGGDEPIVIDLDDAAAPRRDVTAATHTRLVGVAGGFAVYATSR